MCIYVYIFILCILKRPCPGPTGYYTPVLGRRVGRTQMEESKTLGSESLNSKDKENKIQNQMRGQ